MGRLVEGRWSAEWYEPDEHGRFERPGTRFRDWVAAAAAAPGRYHLYAAYACPWAQRTLIVRSFRRLEGAIGVSLVDPHMGDDGWAFTGAPGTTDDQVNGFPFLRDVYLAADARYTGRVTTPILWDTRARTIVNNESREIMRMLDVAFAALGDSTRTLLPAGRKAEVDAVLDAIYEPVNNGVYRAGFAATQAAYEDACEELFAALAHWDGVLGRQRYLCGPQPTEADVALYTTLARFDAVYYGHFKCNLRRLRDHRHLWGYLRDLYVLPGFGETTRLDQIKTHYYWSQTTLNPTRIVPLGPVLDLDKPHDRARLD